MFLTGVARLGRDIEVRQTASGMAVANLALAYECRDRKGERVTQWLDATLLGEQAVKLQAYLIKGTVLTVSLRDVRVEAFTRRDGTTGTKLIATVQSLEFTPRQREKEASSTPAAPKPPRAAPAKSQPAMSNDPAPFDDDIPF